MDLKHLLLLLGLGLGMILPSCGPNMPEDVAEAYAQLPDDLDFNFDVKPILSDRCFSCHGPDEKSREEDLRLDTKEGLFGEGSRRKPIIPGNPDESATIWHILQEDPDEIMPPPDSKLTLSVKEKAILVKWVEEGAEWKDHWAFIPPEQANFPKIKQKKWPKNAIDHFVLAKMEQEGLAPSEEANKETLIRRLSLDLRGLPPSLAEIDAFLKNDSPQAYEDLVDAFLVSSSYGERWCWEWLDAARYADTNGFQGDPERNMWPWREWVIQALNDNMPYDQFTIEQLAGDLLPQATKNQILATAFNRNHMYNGEGGRIPEETRVENVFDRTETMGTIWLGLTLNCTRCHDHKFDPISQKEYYQFYDFFNQTSEEGTGRTGYIQPVLDLSDEDRKAELAVLSKLVEKASDKVESYEKILFARPEGADIITSENAKELSGDDISALELVPGRRGNYLLGLLKRAFKDKDKKYVRLLDELGKAVREQDNSARNNLQVMVMDELEEKRPTYILTRGTYNKYEDQVSGGVPKVLPPLEDKESINRLSLANWLVSSGHPLTSRVTVNRFWQAFFGRGIVKTVDDFGIQGSKPSHPKLLDWLAVEFEKSGWDVKALHKMIVMSATYRQSSKVSPALLEVDPENKWLAHGARKRIPSWMMRDQALFMSGLLVDSLGGPSVKPYQPPGVWEEATFGFKTYQQDHGNKLYRKTLYSFWRRIVGPTMLFDNSARQTCSVNMSLTNTPLHALTTLNDITYVEAARVMAEKLITSYPDDQTRLQTAFRMATARFPAENEQEILEIRLEKLKQAYHEKLEEAEKILSVGEWPINEDLDSVEFAAYTGICSMLMNLDETITKQ